MFQADAYEYICKLPEQIPEQARGRIRPEIAAQLGLPVKNMFPEFAEAFPLTVTAMDTHFSRPIAGLEQRPATGNWLTVLLLENPHSNLFFDLRSINYPLNGPDYDRDHAMLPPQWRELYRWFESFVITAGSVKPMEWWNTPFSYAGRLNFTEFCQGSGATKADVRSFKKIVDSDQMMCWLLTEGGDALFLDEARCDHKVYHVRGSALSDAVVLPNAHTTLDRYLAHVVSGGLPANFEFRS